MTNMTRITCVVAMLAASATACKKDDKAGDKGAKGTSAGKTTTQAPTPASEAPTWTSEDSMAAFNACWDAFNAGDADKLGSCYDTNGTMIMVDFIGPPMKPIGPAAVTTAIKQYKAGFPDAKAEPQLVLAFGNKVAAIGIETATNSGAMMGRPATNKKTSSMFAQIVHFNDKGKITRDWHLSDQTTWAHQLGMHSPPKGAPPSPSAETAWETKSKLAAPPAKIGENSHWGLVKSLIEAMDKKDMATIKAHTGADIVFRYVPHADVSKGAEAYFKGMTMWHEMYESLDRKIIEVFGAGEWVVVRSTATRKLGVDLPNPKKVSTKGKEIMTTSIEFFQVKDTLITQHWVFENSFAFAVQAGLADAPKIPAPATD